MNQGDRQQYESRNEDDSNLDFLVNLGDRQQYEPRNEDDPKLEFCSDSFDPVRALNSRFLLPFPQAKTYNNLAEYYSHTFLKKDCFKKVEKDRPYDRDYSYYFATLGMDQHAQDRYKYRKNNRKKKYAGWRTAKMRKYQTSNDDPNREPCRSYPPLQSAKVIQTQSALTKYKIIPLGVTSDISAEQKISGDQVNDMSDSNKPFLDISMMVDSGDTKAKTSIESNTSQTSNTEKAPKNSKDSNYKDSYDRHKSSHRREILSNYPNNLERDSHRSGRHDFSHSDQSRRHDFSHSDRNRLSSRNYQRGENFDPRRQNRCRRHSHKA